MFWNKFIKVKTNVNKTSLKSDYKGKFPKDGLEGYLYVNYDNKDQVTVWKYVPYVTRFKYQEHEPGRIKGFVEFDYRSSKDELIKLLNNKKTFNIKVDIVPDMKGIVSESIIISNVIIYDYSFNVESFNEGGSMEYKIMFIGNKPIFSNNDFTEDCFFDSVGLQI